MDSIITLDGLFHSFAAPKYITKYAPDYVLGHGTSIPTHRVMGVGLLAYSLFGQNRPEYTRVIRPVTLSLLLAAFVYYNK